jgi:hypothetical protein
MTFHIQNGFSLLTSDTMDLSPLSPPDRLDFIFLHRFTNSVECERNSRTEIDVTEILKADSR